MMRRLLPIAASLLIAGCVTDMSRKTEIPLIDAPGSKQKLSSQLTVGKYESSVMSLGSERDLAQERGRHMGFVKNKGIDTYLNAIRERLVKASGVTDVPGQILVVANTAYMAKASADGNIYVSMAWLPDAQTEDELAAIIAHELAHVLLKHQSTNIIGLTQKRLQSAHELLLGGKMSAKQTTELGLADKKALLAAQLSVEIVDKIAMPAWNRRQETEADLLGIDLMTKAGYSPEGMTDMLSRLDAWEKRDAESKQDQQKRWQELAKQNPEQAINGALNTVIAELSKEHPETDKRIESVAEYLDRHYGDASFAEPSKGPIRKLKSTPSIRSVLDNYRNSMSAKKLLEKNQAKAAFEKARLGVLPPTDKDPLPNWILWQTSVLLGTQGKYLKALEYARNSPEPIPEVYRASINYEESHGNLQKALQLADRANAAFGDGGDWTPDRIRLLTKLGRKGDANEAVYKCAIDTPQIRKECYAATKL